MSTKVRKTQVQRRAETQRALLDATLDSLVELGYRATTTTEVTRRAGVSTGAMLHSFPSKTDLLVAAVEHAFDRRQEEFRKAMTGLDPSADRVDAAIDLLWSMFSGPTFTAVLELWVAARTDPELAAAVVAMDRRFGETSKQVYAELFASQEAAAFPPIGLHLASALLDGLAWSRSIDGYEPHPAEEVLAAFKALIRLSINVAQGDLKTDSRPPKER